MKKVTHEEWLVLWHKALDLAACSALPDEVFDNFTRHRLTGFLCEKALESGRSQKKGRAKGRVIKQRRTEGKPADLIQE
jgi:hypothetical protein